MKISQLSIYPIKSLGGINLNESEIDERGLKHDRRWMLVDETNTFLSQRKFPKMAKFHINHNLEGFTVKNIGNGSEILVPFLPETKNIEKVKIWNDEVEATEVSQNINQWFSEQLNFKTMLFFQHEQNRKIDPKYSINGEEQTSFSDGYPILIIGESSLSALNEKLEKKILMNRFRPNIVFSGGEPFCEDDFKAFKVNDVELAGVKPCERCQITTINQETLEIGKEPLLTLSKFRKFGNKILFGQNVVVHKTGLMKIGDNLSF